MDTNLPRLASSAIPQADNPQLLVRAWRLIAGGEVCDANTLGVHPRQVAYYRSALKILGLLEGNTSAPPAQGEMIAEDAIATLKNRFEHSECGRTWLAWSGAKRLEDVDPSTAMSFLTERSELSGSTLERRATSLKRWHAWMTRRKPMSELPSACVEDKDTTEDDASTIATAYGHYAPRGLEPGSRWEHWDYAQWNERLVDHYLGNNEPERANQPVDRIPATPEELAVIAGAAPSEAPAVADTFVRRIIDLLPLGKKSFCGFCLDYESWNPHAPEPPHFFAMLWFTCLVAYGYPNGEGSFADRLRNILGKADNFQFKGQACLPTLWKNAAEWTRVRREAGDPIRELELPPLHRLAVIGHSHYLAFPNRFDRHSLARILWDAGLVGFEPPVKPVVQALSKGRKHFGRDFLEDLDDFEQRHAEGEDPRDSAFWRAVRQEALHPSIDSSAKPGERNSRTGLLFLEDDQGLRPIICCRLDQPLPDRFEAHLFEEPVTWPAYVTGEGGDLEAAWREAFGEGQLLPVGARRLISQGVLVLRESASGQYEVVSGAEIHGCRRALVKRTLVEAFIEAFPDCTGQPRTQPSLVDEWVEVEGCAVQQVDELPQGLEMVTQLLRTMSPPSVALAGGVRTAGGFLFVPGLLPIVRAPGVRTVGVVSRERGLVHPCTESVDRTGEWLLPKMVDRPGTYILRSSWSMSTNVGSVERTSDTRLHFDEHVIDDHYRGKPNGHYFVESCPEPEVDVAVLPEVPLGISTAMAEQSSDLLDFDASTRFLGSGLGEMSLEPKPGFDWLVVGRKKNPEILVFIGDATNPSQPSQRRSPAKGDHRAWRRGFESRQSFIRLPDGRFVSLQEAPIAVREAHIRYRRHQAVGGEECPPTGLEAQVEFSLTRTEPSAATSQAVDVLAAFGSRRAGLSYSEVREVFQALLGNDDPIALQQILRGWTEAGLIDTLRDARLSKLTLVPRLPRFVMVRRGPEVEATLVGLVSSVRRRRIDRVIDALDPSFVHKLLPANPWQPSTLRLRGTLDVVEWVRRDADLSPSEWLDWPSRLVPPSCLDIAAARARILKTEPPNSYRFDAGWDWSRACFYRGHRSPESIRLERRLHVDLSAIYVLMRDDQLLLWTHSRAWALLEAYAARGVPPFKTESGVLTSSGQAPVHLPLPVGRLCLLIGEALPGPALDSAAIHYTYPFGPRLFGLVERVLPPQWIERPAQTSRSIHAGPHR